MKVGDLVLFIGDGGRETGLVIKCFRRTDYSGPDGDFTLHYYYNVQVGNTVYRCDRPLKVLSQA